MGKKENEILIVDGFTGEKPLLQEHLGLKIPVQKSPIISKDNNFGNPDFINIQDMLANSNYFSNCEKIERLKLVNQDTKLAEEMNELSQALLKRLFHNNTKYKDLDFEHKLHINDEIADVLITLFGFIKRNNVSIENINEKIEFKLNRFDSIVSKM